MAKLLVCIVHSEDTGPVIRACQERGLRVTQLDSQGGFLGAGNATLLLGVEDEKVQDVIAILQRECETRTQQVPVEMLGGMDAGWLPTEVTHGGATIFVVPLDEIHRI